MSGQKHQPKKADNQIVNPSVDDNQSVGPPSIRVDKWLWFARQTKTRSLAQKLIQSGALRINGEKILITGKAVKPGDVLTLNIAQNIRILKIEACGLKRGPFSQAQNLYEDLSPPVDATPRLTNAELGLPHREARPDSRERHAARKLMGKD